jgi:hypothetical protein
MPMFRRTVIFHGVCCLLSGCGLLADNRCVSKPPQDEVGARKWWEETVARVDNASLRCWYQASEIHRQRGSSATYLLHWYLGHTMAGPYYYDQYYPTPIPADLLPTVEARLAKENFKDDIRADLVTVEQCENCSKQEAWDAWKRHGK